MNRYPLWKYATIIVALIVSIFYTLPNFFGQAPALQITAAKSSSEVNLALQSNIEQALQSANIIGDNFILKPEDSIVIRFNNEKNRDRAHKVINQLLNPNLTNTAYTVAITKVSNAPDVFNKFNAHPMYLGLDLRGGVHFMLQLDMNAIVEKRLESLLTNLRNNLREARIPNLGIKQEINSINNLPVHSINIDFANNANLSQAQAIVKQKLPELTASAFKSGENWRLNLILEEKTDKTAKENALHKNIETLRNRINQLGVSEPVIQQQGSDRIIVQLPGVENPAIAKSILGKTATLELRMVDESPAGRAAESNPKAPVPFGSEKFFSANGQISIVKREIILTGENLTDAQPGFTHEENLPMVSLTLDSAGAAKFRDITRKNVGKRMAIILFEKGIGEVVTAPVIRGEIPNGQVIISGSMGIKEAQTTALLLRAGALAAPMEIIEEKTIGPSLGAENIIMGINSVTYGFLIIVVFMLLYYHLMGLFSSIALAFNLFMLMAVLSMLQATLTLPGIAALALALGMAIDSNVLINERIREELRGGMTPQIAISTGFERAWATILDANVTTLIAAVALLTWGTGPIRGFAIVHGLGVLTSMFTSVFFMRGLVNFWYGRKKRLEVVSVGQIWKPTQATNQITKKGN